MPPPEPQNGLQVAPNGTRYWYVDDMLHRTDGPAVELPDGGRTWYVNGQPHREDGPAVEGARGTEIWFRHGTLHRTDGPARREASIREWWVDGKRHRVDGPAVELLDGTDRREWWVWDRKLKSGLACLNALHGAGKVHVLTHVLTVCRPGDQIAKLAAAVEAAYA